MKRGEVGIVLLGTHAGLRVSEMTALQGGKTSTWAAPVSR